MPAAAGRPRSGPAAALGLASLVVAGLWPFLATLDLAPLKLDGVEWIERARVDASGWARWVFGTRHFGVGYRPATALSYSATWALGGLDPRAYHATDLLLHALAAWLVAALERRLFPEGPPWARFVAAGVFLAHPLTEEVLPLVSCRAYVLAAALSCAGLVLADEAFARAAQPRARGLLAGLAGLVLALALLAHEGAVLAAPVALVLAHRRRARARAALWILIAPVALAVGLRLALVGGIGGYEAARLDLARVPPVAGRMWSELAGHRPGMGRPGTLGAPAGAALLLLAAPYYAWQGLRRSGARRTLALWLLAFGVLYPLLGVWYSRQGYLVTVPLALLVADVLARTLTRERGLRRVIELVPQGALVACLLARSPLAHGQDPERLANWAERERRLSALHAALTTVEPPAVVRTVLPCGTLLRAGTSVTRADVPRDDLVPAAWERARLRGSGVALEEFLYVPLEPGAAWALLDGDVVVVPQGVSYLLPSVLGSDLRDARAPRRVPADTWPLPRDRATWLCLAAPAGPRLTRVDGRGD